MKKPVEHPKPPKGVVLPAIAVDSADYLDGMDQIHEKYSPGFLKKLSEKP